MDANYQKITGSEKRYERLLQYLTDYIYTVHVYKGEVVNTVHGPGVVSVTGYTSSDFAQSPELWYKMIHDDDRDMIIERANRALTGEPVETVEHRMIHRDGSVRWVSNSIVLSKDAKGFLHYYDGLIKDITSLKKAEEEARIKQQQLVQADKMVSLGILVSGVAHEISNPNNFIMLNIDLFSKVWKDIQPILNDYYKKQGDFVIAGMPFSKSFDKICAAMDGIASGSWRINEIISNLTSYARMDSGNVKDRVDISDALNGAHLITQNLLKKSTSYFKIKKPRKLPFIRGNQQQLEQVLINLITNACQSLEDISKKIIIEVIHDENEKRVCIVVSDEGRGISEENLKRVFEPFFTTKRDYGGSGLGLSITYNIVKSHGGDLLLESEIGRGTKAIVTFPVFDNDGASA